MAVETPSQAFFRFGTFEVDLRSGELRKQGVRVKIQEQPFHVLTLLLQTPGEVVMREELRSRIWPSDTFVDFDNGLNTSINRLREALGDSAANPRFIETLPRRGYRFIAPVTTVAAKTDVTSEPSRSQPPRARWLVVATAILALGVLVVWKWHPRPRSTEKDTIVLADFTNTTGDPVFDGTLRQGLAVQLEQSPFLRLVSEEQIQQTLGLMKQALDTKLTPEIAREICQRTNSSVALDGSIVQIGMRYSLILKAVNCENDESLASAEAQASDKSHVLEALGKASSEMRNKLGESQATVQKFDTPLIQASTSSLEALRAYSMGYKAVTGKGDSAAAIPFFQRAITLDPNFAMAHVLLGSSYWNLGENNLASDNIRKAFELRASVSEWEKLRIEAEYHSLVTCDLVKAQRALEVWAQTYPKDWAPRNRLGVVYSALGQYEKALAVHREAQNLYPQSGLVRGNIIYTYIRLDRYGEAHAAADEAKVKNPDSPQLRIGLYRLAFLENDKQAMDQQVALGLGKPGIEDSLLWNEAATAAYFGQLAKARAFYAQAVASAERTEAKEEAAAYEANAALTEALFGYGREARQRAGSALLPPIGPDTQYLAALALALAGEESKARALAEGLSKRSPEDTVVQFLYLPTLQAQLAAKRNDAPRAIQALQAATPYELGTTPEPVYFRGLAYLAAHRGSQAASEFQKIIDHRGIVLNAPIGALAHLQIGRALAMQGDMAKARNAYQDFLLLWKDADPDLPILRQAKAEYARLQAKR
jgi:DNA-binding winged helix-turn-helix (wHTH) protein/Flp pilus assembly protein TadD